MRCVGLGWVPFYEWLLISESVHDFRHAVQWVLRLLLNHILGGFTVLVLHRRVGPDRKQGLHCGWPAIPWRKMRETTGCESQVARCAPP